MKFEPNLTPEQAHALGVKAAALGWAVGPGGVMMAADANYRAFRVGHAAELVRISNRRMTGRHRDFLIAHDKAVAAFYQATDPSCDALFARADFLLFGLNPWDVLGIRLAQYQGPAGQAKDRLYVPVRKLSGGKP